MIAKEQPREDARLRGGSLLKLKVPRQNESRISLRCNIDSVRLLFWRLKKLLRRTINRFFFSWKVDFLSFKKRPNINLYIEYSRTLIWVFEDSKFAYKTTKFYAKWPVRNFGQKHDLQYLEKYAMLSWDSNSLCGRTVYFTIFKVIFA